MGSFFDSHRNLFEVDRFMDAEAIRATSHGAEGAEERGQRPQAQQVRSYGTSARATPAVLWRKGVFSANISSQFDTAQRAALGEGHAAAATPAPFATALKEIEVFGDIGVLPSARGDPRLDRGRDDLSPQQQRMQNWRASTEGPAPWMRDTQPRSPPGRSRPALPRSPIGASGAGYTSPDRIGQRRRRGDTEARPSAPSQAARTGLDHTPSQRSHAHASPSRAAWARQEAPSPALSHRGGGGGTEWGSRSAAAADADPIAESRPVPRPFERGYHPLYGPDNPRSKQALEEAVDMGNPLRPPIAVSRGEVRRKVSRLMGTLWTGERCDWDPPCVLAPPIVAWNGCSLHSPLFAPAV